MAKLNVNQVNLDRFLILCNNIISSQSLRLLITKSKSKGDDPMSGLIPFNRRGPRARMRGFEDFYGLLDDFFNEPRFMSPFRDTTFRIDVKEKKDKYIVEAEVPGVSKKEINLRLEDGRLTIGIEREERKDEEEKDYIHKERRYASMSRSIYLGNVKEDKARAKLKDGILKIEVPKSQVDDTRRQIPID